MNKARRMVRTASTAALGVMAFAEAADAQGPRVVRPDAGMVASVDAARDTLESGTTRGLLSDLYWNRHATYGWERTATEIASNGLFRADYSVFKGEQNHSGAGPNLSILLFRPPLITRSGAAEPTNDFNWEREMEVQQKGIRGVLPASRRSQKALWAVEQALNGAQFFAANAGRYQFSGANYSFSFVSLLPESFPGVGASGGSVPRRVSVSLEAQPRNQYSLMLEHTPLLLDGNVEPFRITLAKDVFLFFADYFDGATMTWTNSWTQTNAMPRQVHLNLWLLPPWELASRRVALPATEVRSEFQIPVSRNGPPPPLVNQPRSLAAKQASVAHATSAIAKPKRSRLWPLRNEKDAMELEWLGRSGVELARYILAQPEQSGMQFDALNQKWAGGVGHTNSPIAHIPMQDFPLGGGTISLRITDLDRKFNINLGLAAPEILQQALILAGADGLEIPSIADAIQDWQDADDTPRAGGAESDYYLTLDPPHPVKNGPLDDLAELLMVKGVTPRMFFGTSNAGESAVGLKDLFTTVSGRLININTASAQVLQLIPDVDGNMAQAIITTRAGPDGVEGNEDDMPFRSAGEIRNVPGMTPEIANLFSRYLGTRSSTFEVTVDVTLGRQTRQYSAWLRRNGSSIQTLKFARTK